MIQTIQLYRLDADASRDRAARALLEELASVPGPLTFEVGLPADAAAAKSWDISLVLTFEDAVAAERTLSGETYRGAVSRALGGSVVVEKGWSFSALVR
ncbi:MAG: hypothetical protein H5U40_03545 [Polyangiaceae bacterium]|nr:hypothetical protein [Polyangiaceae bacterium]